VVIPLLPCDRKKARIAGYLGVFRRIQKAYTP